MGTEMERLDEIRARVEAATPGPWERGDRYHVAGVVPDKFGEGKCAYCVNLGEPEWAGRRDINGTRMLAHVHITDKPWSPYSIYAYPEPGEPDCVVVETDEYGLIGDADATFIAHSRADVPYLLDLVASLTFERDAAIQRYAAQEDFWTDWLNQFDVLMDDIWDDDMSMNAIVFDWVKHTAAELTRLRAVIEEARALAVSDHDMDTRQELAARFLAILDRGLKGAGGE